MRRIPIPKPSPTWIIGLVGLVLLALTFSVAAVFASTDTLADIGMTVGIAVMLDLLTLHLIEAKRR